MTDPEDRTWRTRRHWHDRLGEAHLDPDLDRLALVIATRANAEGRSAMWGVKGLAERLDVSPSTVKRRLARLEGGGWIRRVQRGHRRGNGKAHASVYDLHVPGESTDHGPAGADPLRPDLNRSTDPPQQVNGHTSTGQRPACDVPPVVRDPSSSRAAASVDRPLPADFTPSDENRAYAVTIGADLAREVAAMRQKADRMGWERRDWQAVLRSWLEHGPSTDDRSDRPVRRADVVPGGPGDTYVPPMPDYANEHKWVRPTFGKP